MATERLAPDAIVSSTNLTGLVTVIQDDPDAPDGLWLTALDTAVPSDLQVSFPTPAGGSPSGTQEARYLVRKVGGANTPSVTVEAYDGVTLLATATFSVSTQTVLALTWAGSGTGAEIEARVFSAAQSGKASNKSTIEVGAVEWNATLADAPTAIGATDTSTLSLTESVGIAVTLQATDTATVGITEATSLEISQAILAGDTVSVGVTEATSLLVTVEPSDLATIAISEAVETLVSLSTSDNVTIRATESVALLNSFSVTDALSISVAEAVSILATLATSEDLAVSVVESSSLTQEGSAEPKAAGDTVTLLITEGAVVIAMDVVATGDPTEGRGKVVIIESSSKSSGHQ